MEDTTEQQSENKKLHEEHADMGDDKEDGTAVDLNPESLSNQFDMERYFIVIMMKLNQQILGLEVNLIVYPAFPWSWTSLQNSRWRLFIIYK